MFNKISIQNRVRFSFALIIIVFVGVSISSFVNFSNLVKLNTQDRDSYTIISKLNDIQQLRRDIQISLQNVSSIDDATTAISTIKKTYAQNISKLKSITASDKDQQTLLKSAETLVNNTISTYETKLDSIKASGTSDISTAIRDLNGPPANMGQNSSTSKSTTSTSSTTTASTSSTTTTTSSTSKTDNANELDTLIQKSIKLEQQHLTDRQNQTNKIKYITFSTLIAGTVISILLVLFIMIIIDYSVVRNIKKTSNMLRDIAEGEGNLTKRLEVNSNDEIGELATWFNKFVEKISVLIGEVITDANVLSKSTEDILSSIEESNAGMGEMVNTIGNVSDSIQTSASASEEAMASIQEVANQANMIQSESQNANESSTRILKVTSDGEAAVKAAVSSISSVKNTSSDVLNVINDLKRASDEISQIVSMMTGITEQTSLLALNASIEAARAGEAGRGFAVVADEVKKLSEESKGSAVQITKIVGDIQLKIQQTEKSIMEEHSFIDLSVDKVSITSEEFSKIFSEVQSISEKINIMTNSSQQQTEVTSEMTKTIDLLSQGLQDNAAASEEISASVETQVNIYKGIQKNMEEIKNIANSLKEQTGKFKL